MRKIAFASLFALVSASSTLAKAEDKSPYMGVEDYGKMIQGFEHQQFVNCPIEAEGDACRDAFDHVIDLYSDSAIKTLTFQVKIRKSRLGNEHFQKLLDDAGKAHSVYIDALVKLYEKYPHKDN